MTEDDLPLTQMPPMRPLCPQCGSPMNPEHAHNRCPVCYFVLPCCEGEPQ